MLLVPGLALAAPYVRPAPLGVHAGVDVGGWLGASGGGLGAGLGERLAVGWAVSTPSELYLAVDHAHAVLVDAGAWLPDAGAPADAWTGGRDEIGLVLGARLGLDRVDERAIDAARPRLYPYLRVEAGVSLTRTTVAMPGFAGETRVQSRDALPRLGLAAGVEVRLHPRVSLLPHLGGSAVTAADPGEVDGGTTWRVETRLAGGVDLRVGL